METTTRQEAIEELNALTERKWDIVEELAEIEVARTALFNKLRTEHDGNN